MEPKVDRRIEKTRKAIFIAFGNLLQKQRYNQITVQNIIDYANIGRTTFYSHFDTKEDLLVCFMNHIFDTMLSNIEEENNEETFLSVIPCKKIFEHLLSHSSQFLGVLKSESGTLFFERAKQYWIERLREALSEKTVPISIPLDIFIDSITNTMIGLIKWWLDNDMKYSAIEMERYWKEITSYYYLTKSLEE